MIEAIVVHPGPVSVRQRMFLLMRPGYCRCRPALPLVESWIAGTILPREPAQAQSVVKRVLPPARLQVPPLPVVPVSAALPLVSQMFQLPAALALQHQALVRGAVEPLRVDRIQTRGAPPQVPAVVQRPVFWAWRAFSELQPGSLKRLSFASDLGSDLFQWRAAD